MGSRRLDAPPRGPSGRSSQAGTRLRFPARGSSLLLPLFTGPHCWDGVQCPPPHLHCSQSHTSVASRLRDIPQIPTSLVSHALLWLHVFSLPCPEDRIHQGTAPWERRGGLLTSSLQRRGGLGPKERFSSTRADQAFWTAAQDHRQESAGLTPAQAYAISAPAGRPTHLCWSAARTFYSGTSWLRPQPA